MSVLGAVVMPHNLFLHSEVIQSRQWNIQDDKIIKKQLRYEYADTILSMVIGWAINSAMILLAAAAFFRTGTPVTELEQANSLLAPLLGNNASVIFAVAPPCLPEFPLLLPQEWLPAPFSPEYTRSLTTSRTVIPASVC